MYRFPVLMSSESSSQMNASQEDSDAYCLDDRRPRVAGRDLNGVQDDRDTKRIDANQHSRVPTAHSREMDAAYQVAAGRPLSGRFSVSVYEPPVRRSASGRLAGLFLALSESPGS